MTKMKLRTPRRSVNLTVLFLRPANLEIRQGHERTHVVVGIPEDLAGVLDPGVSEELTVLPAANAHANDGALDPPLFEHTRKRDGPDQALGAKHAKPSCTDNSHGKPSSLRHPREVGAHGHRRGRRERPNGARSDGEMRSSQCPLSLEEIEPLPGGKRRQLLRDVSDHESDSYFDAGTTNPLAVSACRNSCTSALMRAAPASGYCCSRVAHNSPNVLDAGGSRDQIRAPTGFTPKYTSSDVDRSTPPSSSSLKIADGLGCGSGNSDVSSVDSDTGV
jgi:hypothetical protein